MRQFPNLPFDNSLPTKVTALTWTPSSNCSCKPSLCNHFTLCKKSFESWLNHYPLSGAWVTLMTDRACEKPWLRSWWGSRAESKDSVYETQASGFRVGAAWSASASRRETRPITPTEMCQAGTQQSPPSSGGGSGEGATDWKQRQHLHVNPLCNGFLLSLIRVLTVREVGGGHWINNSLALNAGRHIRWAGRWRSESNSS